MSNYSIVPFAARWKAGWSVREEPTNQIICYSMFEDESTKVQKHMAGGGAFDGHTPKFFLFGASVRGINIDRIK